MTRRISVLAALGFTVGVVSGCGLGVEVVEQVIDRTLGSTIDLSGESTKSAKLVNFCNCIESVDRKDKDGNLNRIWKRGHGHEPRWYPGFTLSPGSYRVTVSEYFRKVGTLHTNFELNALPGHTYAIHRLYCPGALTGWLFLEPRCPPDVYYAGFIWLADQTERRTLKKASISY